MAIASIFCRLTVFTLRSRRRAISTSAGTSSAEPTGAAVSPTAEVEEIAQGERDDPVEVRVEGSEGVDVTFREITLPPGAGTGRHCHHGQLVAVVKEGTLTHYADIYPGGVHVYGTGEAIIEGAGYPHEGRNEGPDDVVLMVTYITPVGEPLAETDLTECDR